MSKFSYIILHYKNMKDTIECVESIKKISKEPIVIVDNHTLKKEQKKELEKYTKDIILLQDNIGFAKANNKGVLYAKEKYNPDFYIVLNNDIVISDTLFEKKIQKRYKENQFDILGPKIDTNNGNSVNPFPVYKTKEEVEQIIKRTKRNIHIFSSKFLYSLFSFYHQIKYNIKPEKPLENGKEIEENIAVHGCAVIFSKKYIEDYKYAFYNDTFLYHEEEFLYYRIKRDKRISVYDPDISLFHKEGASLNQLFNQKNREKELFRNKEILKSLEKLYVIMNNNEKI